MVALRPKFFLLFLFLCVKAIVASVIKCSSSNVIEITCGTRINFSYLGKPSHLKRDVHFCWKKECLERRMYGNHDHVRILVLNTKIQNTIVQTMLQRKINVKHWKVFLQAMAPSFLMSLLLCRWCMFLFGCAYVL